MGPSISTVSPVALGYAQLLTIQNPAGSTWTVNYDSSHRVSSVADPFTRRTTFNYSGSSGKITGILDPFGRITSFSVNSSGNLAQVTSPELCLSSLVYDSSNRAIAWINPLADRTSYSYNASNQLVQVQSPLGLLTTIAYGAKPAMVTNPRGFTTTHQLQRRRRGQLGDRRGGEPDQLHLGQPSTGSPASSTPWASARRSRTPP